MKPNNTARRAGVFVMVLTLVMLACSGSSGISGLFATETPTPTITYTPSPTFTPSPTPTATLTPSPTPLPTGVTTQEQSDGSTLFVDYDNGYQLKLPQNWIVIPLSSDDLASVLQRLSEKNPAFKDMAETFKQLDPDVIRVIAVNSDAKYIYKGFSTNLTVTALDDPLMSTMPLEFVTGAVEESLKQQGAKLLSHNEPVITNANGVDVGTFSFQQTAPTALGANIQARSKTLLFQVEGKIIMIQLAMPQQFAEELLPMLDDVADSIKLLKP